MSINLSSGPSSWDRDMQGMPGMDEEESNLAALGMHVTGGAKSDDDDDDDEADVKIKDEAAIDEVKTDDEVDEAKKEEEEVDALEELDILAKKLKEEDAPTMGDEEE